ncbi:MAG: hypothetical protein EBX52_02795 [Proteobacteria bacterium]|nr:hypothetical protein [Pseudomonadota bacterium]
MSPRISDLMSVLGLFVIPIGGGIPAGVLLAKSKGFGWLATSFVYLISDLLLACVFDPLMWGFVRLVKRSTKQELIFASLKGALQKSIPKLGVSVGPLSLILIAFGTDPMTGRVVTAMKGHGFITGWAISIAGDMIFFALIMASTLWLNGILGDGTLTSVIVIAGMFVIPALFRKIREKLKLQRR